ncbi:ester cyclase [Pendulispora albinea]|uniref:Ester cyclase n=1 Tax=Pendulispora albinea TaxID=2741071 RepID=A0ABZ2M0I7_9BACT
MRKGHVALIFGFLVSACGGGEEAAPPPQTPPPAPAPAPAPEAPKAEAPKPEVKPGLGELEAATNKALVEALNAHDAKKVASLYAEDAVITIPGVWINHGQTQGRADIEKSTQAFFDAFKDVKFWVSRAWVKQDVAALEFGWSGTHSGDYLGVKASDKPAGAVGVSLVTYDNDGHIKQENRYSDLNTVFTQIGLVKGKARPVPTAAASTEVVIAKGTPEEDKNLATVKGLNGAFESKKEADFLTPLADDVDWTDYSQPESTKGKDSAKKFFQGFVKTFPDAKSDQTAAFGVGDFVIQETSFVGTQKGALGPIKATNKQVNLHSVDVIQFKDGKITKGWSFGNSIELVGQLGVFKPPAPAAAKPGAGAKPADKAANGAVGAKGSSAPAAAPKAPAAPKK